MKDCSKYAGIFPAFYACYDENGEISPKAVRELTQYYIDKKVTGLYVGGSSGECIYQHVPERKLLLEEVMKVAKGKLTIIAHVACNNTADSMELAAHAESLGVDAIAAIPPIYFHLPDAAIAKYWNDISSAAPNTDFIIYNIPQLAGVGLNPGLMRMMLANPNVIGVKNSSTPIEDIERWISCGAVAFNGPDEQLLAGITAGAIGGIGGTYGAMPEVYEKIYQLASTGENLAFARELQQDANQIIYKMCSGKGNMYAMIKEILRLTGGPDIGGVRAPLLNLTEDDKAIAVESVAMIEALKAKLNG